MISLLNCSVDFPLRVMIAVGMFSSRANCNPLASGRDEMTRTTLAGNLPAFICSRMFFNVLPPPLISTASFIGLASLILFTCFRPALVVWLLVLVFVL